MSMQVSRRSANPIEKKETSPLEELPDELLRIVLSYLDRIEGCALIALNHSFRTRIIDIIKQNHKKYLTGLTEKLLLYFPFLPEEYREHVRITSEKTLGQKFTKLPAKSPSPLNTLARKSRRFGIALTGKYFETSKTPSNDSPIQLFQICKRTSYKTITFFIPYSERIDKSLISLGVWFTEYLPEQLRLDYKTRLVELCERTISEEKKEQIIEQKRQQIWLNIIYKRPSSFFRDLAIETRRLCNLTDKIAKPTIKDRGYRTFLWMPIIKDDPFLQTAECFSRLSPQTALYYFGQCRNWRKAIPCLDKITRCSNQQEKLSLFFQFSAYFFYCLLHSTNNRPPKAEFCSKLAELTNTLEGIGEQKTIVRVLREIMEERINTFPPLNTLDGRPIDTLDYGLLSACICRLVNDHLMKQVRQKVIRPSEMLEITYELFNQLKKSYKKHDCLMEFDDHRMEFSVRSEDVWHLFTNAAMSCNDSIEASRTFSMPLDHLLSRDLTDFISDLLRNGAPIFPGTFPLDRHFLLTKLIETINNIPNIDGIWATNDRNRLLSWLERDIAKLSKGVDISLRIYLMAGVLKGCFPNKPSKDKAIFDLLDQYRKAPLKYGEDLAKIFLLIPEITDETKRRELLFSLSEEELATLIKSEEGTFSEKNLFDFIQSTPWQDTRDFLRGKSLHAIAKYAPQKGQLFKKLCETIENPAIKEEAFRLWARRNWHLLSLLLSSESFFSLKDFSHEEILPLILSYLEGPLQNDVLYRFFASSLYYHASNPQARENFLNFCKQIFEREKLEALIVWALLERPDIPFQVQIECFEYLKDEELRGKVIKTLVDSFLASLPDRNFPPVSAALFIKMVSLQGEAAKRVLAALRAKKSAPFEALTHALELKILWEEPSQLNPPGQLVRDAEESNKNLFTL